MMNKLRILLIIFCLCILTMASLVLSEQYSTPMGQFNVTPDFLYLNWTNNYASNITIEVFNDTYANLVVKVLNDTSDVIGNYSQDNTGNVYCYPVNYHLFVVNTTGGYNNTLGPITDYLNITINDTKSSSVQCKPGRYWVQSFTIKNESWSNETVNITVFIDVPIIPSTTTGATDFNGVLILNASTYHSFFFNTSYIPNTTGLKFNISGWSSSQDLDIFLLDNSQTPALKSKAINTTTSESLLYYYLPQNVMWELRAYANSTSNITYTANVIFTTLNATNASEKSQHLSSVNLGNLNASETKQVNITLKNEGNLNLTGVTQYKELYLIRIFGGNSPKNFTVLVPNSSIVSKIKASLNWTGSSNYTLKIYNQNDSLVTSSTNKYIIANRTGVMHEEFSETTNIGSNGGIWKFEVLNSSLGMSQYNLTVYLYFSPNNWIVTNYTTMNFNMTGVNNYTNDVLVNITILNNSLDGSYEGYIHFLDNNGVGIKVPLIFTVRTPSLSVNNYLSSMTSASHQNYGENYTKTINFILNNTGYYNLSLSFSNSSSVLTCAAGSCSGNYANLNFNQTSFVNNYSFQQISANITFNSSMPVGVYEGWVLINGSNPDLSLASHPYEMFNLTLRLNLTNFLDVRNYALTSSVGNDNIISNSSAAEDITLRFKIYYANGSEIGNQNALNASNFSVWLTHKNRSSYIIPSSGNLTTNNETPIYVSDYSLIATVPANYPGGRYDVHLATRYLTSTGTGIYGSHTVNQTLLINNSAVYLTFMNSSSIIADEFTTAYYFVNATNYGLKTAMGTITFSNTSCAYDIFGVETSTSSCSATASGNTWKNINLANGSSCYFGWKLTFFNVTGDRSCGVSAIKITYNESNLENVTLTNILVYDADEGGSTTTTTTGSSEEEGGSNAQSTTTTTTVPAVTVKYINITSYPSIVSIAQGANKSESITVMNVHNNITQRINLTVLFIDSAWYRIASNNIIIANKSSYIYNITFMISDNATVKDYSGKFFAESSYGGNVQTFTLRVTPGMKLQSQISANLSSLRIEIQELEKEINKSKYQNNSEAKSFFNQLKQKFNQASTYYNQSDYRSAYDLLANIESLLNQTRTSMALGPSAGTGGLKIDLKGSSKFIIIVIVIVVVVVVVAYLFWPTPGGGFKPIKGFTPEVKKDDKKAIISGQLDKLKEKWRKAQERKD